MGIEAIFANGNVYLFRYGGLSYGKTMDDMINWITTSLVNSFSAANIKKNIRKLFSANASLCLFAVFNSTSSTFQAMIIVAGL